MMNSWGTPNFLGGGSHGQNMGMNQNAPNQYVAAGAANYAQVNQLQQMQQLQMQQMHMQQMQPQQMQLHQMQQQQMQQQQMQQHQMQHHPTGVSQFHSGNGDELVALRQNVQRDTYTASAAWPPIEERQDYGHESRSVEFVSGDSDKYSLPPPKTKDGELDKRDRNENELAMRRPKGHGWPREKHRDGSYRAEESERKGWAKDKSFDHYKSSSSSGSRKGDKHASSKTGLNSSNDVTSKCPICKQSVTLENWVQHATTHADTSADSKAHEVGVDYLFISDLLKEASRNPKLVEKFECQICGVHNLLFEELLEHIQGSTHMHALYRWMFSPSSPGHHKYKEHLPNIPIKNRHLKCHFCELCVRFAGSEDCHVAGHVKSKLHLAKLSKVREDLQWVKKGLVIRSEGGKFNSDGGPRDGREKISQFTRGGRELPAEQSRRGVEQLSKDRRMERRDYRSGERDKFTSGFADDHRSLQDRRYAHSQPLETERFPEQDMFMRSRMSPLPSPSVGRQYNSDVSRQHRDSYQPPSQASSARRDFPDDDVFRRGSFAYRPQAFNQDFRGSADHAPSRGTSSMNDEFTHRKPFNNNSGSDRMSSSIDPFGSQLRGREKPSLGGLNRGKLQEIVHSIRSSSAIDKESRKSISLDSMKEASRSKAAVLATVKEVNQKMSENRSRQQPLRRDRSYSPTKEMAHRSDLCADERSGHNLMVTISSGKASPGVYAPRRISRSPNRHGLFPDRHRLSPDRHRLSPDRRKYSPVQNRYSPERSLEKAEGSKRSPGSGRQSKYEDRRRGASPSSVKLTLDEYRVYPERQNSSPDFRSSHTQKFSPDQPRLSSGQDIDFLKQRESGNQRKGSSDRRRIGSADRRVDPSGRQIGSPARQRMDSPDRRRVESSDRRRVVSSERRHVDSSDQRPIGSSEQGGINSFDKKVENSLVRQQSSSGAKKHSPSQQRRSPEKRRGSPNQFAKSTDKGLVQPSIKEKRSETRDSDLSGFSKRTRSPDQSWIPSGRKSLSPLHRTSAGNEHHRYVENLTPNVSYSGKLKRRLSPLVLSVSDREVLTKRIEETWQKYYHKYYSCIVTNPEIVLEMQKEYLRSYRGFFKEDPFFEFYYTKVAKPEDLREALTLRIDRGSPGPDPNSNEATAFIDPLLRQHYEKGLPEAHSKALKESIQSRQMKLPAPQTSTGENLQPPVTPDMPQTKLRSSGDDVRNPNMPESTAHNSRGKPSKVHEVKHQQSPMETHSSPDVIVIPDEEVDTKAEKRTRTKSEDLLLPPPTKLQRKDMPSKHKPSSPSTLPDKSKALTKNMKPNIGNITQKDTLKDASGSKTSDGIFPDASRIYINEDRFKDRSEQITDTQLLEKSIPAGANLDNKWSADHLSIEPVITSTTQGLPAEKQRRITNTGKSRSVLGRLGPQRKHTSSARSSLDHHDQRKSSTSKPKPSSLNDRNSRSKPHTHHKQGSSDDLRSSSKRSGLDISARLGPHASDKYKTTKSAFSEIFADPFLGFVHKTLTGIILIGEYQKSMATSSKPEDMLAKINAEQEEMKARMVTSDGHLLIQLARCCIENPDSIEQTFPQVTADVGPILRSLDKQVVTLIADTPIITDYTSPFAEDRNSKI